MNKEYQKGYDAGIKSIDYLVKKKTTPSTHIIAGLLTSVLNMAYFKTDKKTIDKIVSFAQITAKKILKKTSRCINCERAEAVNWIREEDC